MISNPYFFYNVDLDLDYKICESCRKRVKRINQIVCGYCHRQYGKKNILIQNRLKEKVRT